ncbi:MAG TPA: type II toxin-antitoxin system death-on-curing family toxin [Candidatus Thermoplasmatota archaeon]|nr:type II toxin-antitoxin system death-on-curing family toxin [Candidatus Thermoplasmatota archaeon]
MSNDDLRNLDKIPYDRTRAGNASWRQINLKEAQSGTKKRVWWPTTEQVITIHDDMIREFGGELGLPRPGMITSALERAKYAKIFGQDQFPTIFDKAASLMHSILLYHPFADGQKRTGLATAFVFLGLNGWTFWSRDYVSEVHFAIEVAKGKHEVPEISDWIKARVAPQSELAKAGRPLLTGIMRSELRALCHYCSKNLRVASYRVYCDSCDVWYEAELKNLVLTWDASGKRNFQAKVDLHKIPSLSGRRLTPEKLREMARARPRDYSRLRQKSLFEVYEDSSDAK